MPALKMEVRYSPWYFTGALLTGVLHLDIHPYPAGSLLNLGTSSVDAESDDAASAGHLLAAMDSASSFEDICTSLNIQEGHITAASYRGSVGPKSPAGLITMIRNHRAMSDLLQYIGQPGYLTDPKGESITTHAQGLVISSPDILRKFGWTSATYKNKSTIFGWASRVAITPWRGPEPGWWSHCNTGLSNHILSRWKCCRAG